MAYVSIWITFFYVLVAPSPTYGVPGRPSCFLFEKVISLNSKIYRFKLVWKRPTRRGMQFQNSSYIHLLISFPSKNNRSCKDQDLCHSFHFIEASGIAITLPAPNDFPSELIPLTQYATNPSHMSRADRARIFADFDNWRIHENVSIFMYLTYFVAVS